MDAKISECEESGSEDERDRGNNARPSSSYALKQKKEYENILEKKERKRLLDIKKQITMKPKRPKLLMLDVI